MTTLSGAVPPRLVRLAADASGERPVHIAVTHAYARDEAEKLKERVADEFNCIELWLSEFSPIMGYACGTGTIGLAFGTLFLVYKRNLWPLIIFHGLIDTAGFTALYLGLE